MTTEAAHLRCPGCGAPATGDLHACAHCGARLATVACPSCFGMVFRGTKHCPHCGARAERGESVDAEKPLDCPRCAAPMSTVQVGAARVRECPRCSGLWLRADAFERVAADAEQQAAVLRFQSSAPAVAAGEERVRYLPCPECGTVMNRTNFQRISGVILDQCRSHGAWFDRDELRRIVEFIRGGGLDLARRRERERLEEERRRLRDKEADIARLYGSAPAHTARPSGGDEVIHSVLRFFGL